MDGGGGDDRAGARLLGYRKLIVAVVGIAGIVLVEMLGGRPKVGEWIVAIVLGQHVASTLRGQARDGR